MTSPRPRIGHYEIIERIGLGGMAEIFRAKARGPGGYERDLVVKCILPHLAGDPEFIRMFIAEAKTLGLLHHPNIVQVYDFGEDGGRHFLALEYIDGPSMAEIMGASRKRKSPVPVTVAAYVAREVCWGLAAIHDLTDPAGNSIGAIHRDVTPSNIMMNTAGHVKLLDFGIVRLGPGVTAVRRGAIKGKPAYLAPEQLLDAPIDARVDLFAMGIVMHEMLTLAPLFWAETDLATIYKVVEREIPRPSSVRSDVPAQLDRIVLRALERSPAQRYQSAVEMARDLDEFIVSSGLRHEEVTSYVQKFKRRRNGSA